MSNEIKSIGVNETTGKEWIKAKVTLTMTREAYESFVGADHRKLGAILESIINKGGEDNK